MTLNELLVQLQNLQEAGHGDVEICVYADHGQSVENAYVVSLEDYSPDDEDLVHPDDLEDYEGYDLEKIVLISS